MLESAGRTNHSNVLDVFFKSIHFNTGISLSDIA